MKKITFPSGVYFVSSKKDIVNSLFNKGGTASGYYKKIKNGIKFYNMQDKPFLFLVNNKYGEQFFVSCDIIDGKIFYFNAVSSSTEKLLGLGKYSINDRELAQDIIKTVHEL